MNLQSERNDRNESPKDIPDQPPSSSVPWIQNSLNQIHNDIREIRTENSKIRDKLENISNRMWWVIGTVAVILLILIEPSLK